MSAQSIAHALDGHRAGACWMARCPAHDDRVPSLSISDAEGIVLVCCHAGCEQQDVIAALEDRGLWEARTPRLVRRRLSRAVARDRSDRNQDVRTTAAMAIWKSTITANGTLVVSYLHSRGIDLAVPSSLRFHLRLKHPSGGVWPGMVALVNRGCDGTPLAIHRTFLARDGSGKAPVEPTKMMLGPCRGGAVYLAEPGDVLMVGEGIETCLAAMQATGNPAWAALSTSGLRALELPGAVREVIVLADGDEPGEAAASECARRWRKEGRRVRIARPPRGLDFNDLLLLGLEPAECGS